MNEHYDRGPYRHPPVASALPLRCADVMTTILHLSARGMPIGHNIIMEVTGLSRNKVNRALHELQDAGLVGFVDRRHGTIYPTVAVVVPFPGPDSNALTD